MSTGAVTPADLARVATDLGYPTRVKAGEGRGEMGEALGRKGRTPPYAANDGELAGVTGVARPNQTNNPGDHFRPA